MNVLSLFDGMSCGQIALNRAGIKYDQYFASEIDKYAMKITQKNFPNTIQLGSVVDIKASDLPQIDLLIGGSPCFPADTLVLTSEGYTPIQDVRVGDKVLTHGGRWRAVLAVGGKSADTIVLKGFGHSGLETTEEHPFLSSAKQWKWDSDRKVNVPFMARPEWTDAKDMKGKYWATIVPGEMSLPIPALPKGYQMNEAFFYFVGRWLGDGWVLDYLRKNRPDGQRVGRVVVCCAKGEADLLEPLLRDMSPNWKKVEDRTVIKFSLGSKELVNWLTTHFGRYSYGKGIPAWALTMPRKYQIALLKGYTDSDGSLRPDGIQSITTVGKKLAVGIRALATGLGYGVSVRLNKMKPQTVIEGRVVNQRDFYTIRWRPDMTIAEGYGYSERRKSHMTAHGYEFGLVRSVSAGRENVQVYNLEVEEDNSYVVENIVVHNCQGFSTAGKQLNFDDPRSKLFFEYVRLLRELKPKYFLLENVKMKKEWEDVISEHMGVKPIKINSSLVSAQNRVRYYWTNIPNVTIPEDRGIVLRDIIGEADGVHMFPRGTAKGGILPNRDKTPPLTTSDWPNNYKAATKLNEQPLDEESISKLIEMVDREKSYAIDANYWKGGNLKTYFEKARRQLVFQYNRKDGVKIERGELEKSLSLLASDWRGLNRNQNQNCVVSLEEWSFRKFTPNECERLQTVPENYTECVSNTQRYRMLGNGWTVDVIAHIFSFMEKV